MQHSIGYYLDCILVLQSHSELKNIVFEIPFAFCFAFHHIFEILQPYESFARSNAISWKAIDKVVIQGYLRPCRTAAVVPQPWMAERLVRH